MQSIRIVMVALGCLALAGCGLRTTDPKKDTVVINDTVVKCYGEYASGTYQCYRTETKITRLYQGPQNKK